MAIEYAGNPIYPATITVLEASDERDEQSVAIPLEQLRDGQAYLKGRIDDGIGFEFTDAILHGDTTFPDGTIDADVDSASFVAANDATFVAFTGTLFLGGNDITIGSTTSLTVNATSIDVMSGKVTVSGTTIALNDDVHLGATNADTVQVLGALDAKAPATFESSATFQGQVHFEDSTTFETGASVVYDSGTTEIFRGRMTLEAAGHIDKRFVEVGATPTSYTIDDGDIYWIVGGTSGVAFTLPNTNARLGSRMRWYSNSASANTLKQANGSTTICTIRFGALSGEYPWVDLVNDGLNNAASSWRICGGSPV